MGIVSSSLHVDVLFSIQQSRIIIISVAVTRL